MANTAVSGKNATVTLDSVSQCAKSWTATVENEMLESTGFCDSGNRTYVAGLQGGTFTVVSNSYFAPSPDTAVTISLADDNVTISGSGYYSLDASVTVEGLSEYTYNGTFTGAITVT